jgi:hypothetical protein
MKPRIYAVLCASISAILVACGGGDGTQSRLTGLAATGAAIPRADVTARCVSGDPITEKTDENGVFTLVLTATHTAPCMLKVLNGSSELYSFASEAGRVNITPATDLLVAHALKGNPSDSFAGFGKEIASGIFSGLDAARTYVKDQLKAVTGADYTGDPITDSLVVGDPNDKVLDGLASATRNAGKTPAELRSVAVKNESLSTILPKDPGTGGETATPTCDTGLFTGGVRTATVQEIASFGTEYTGEAGTFNDNFEFTKTGTVSLALTATGALTVNAQTQTVSSICMETAASQLVIHFGANKGHVDLKAAGKFNGVMTDGTVIRNAQTTQSPTSSSFFGSNKTAADIAFLNGQSFTGTNCSVSFANGTMTVTDTTNNRTASATFSGDAFDRIVPANGRSQIDFEVGDDLQIVNGKTYPATGKPSAQGRFQMADYVNTQATVLEAYVNQHDGSGKTTGAACRNLNKALTSWVRPPLSTGNLNLLETYSIDTSRHIVLATDVPKLAGTYTGIPTGTYQKVQLKPSISTLTNLTGQTCSLTVDTQGLATLTVADKTRADSLVGEWVLFHGGSMLKIASASSVLDVEYVKGYQFGQVGADLYITWADAAQYQGPVTAEFKATASDNASRENFTCTFK